MDDDTCDFCGESLAENGVGVDVEMDDPFRIANGYFCSWEHAASWFATGESDKDFDVIFPEGTSLTRRERLWEAVEPVGVFILFLWAIALMLIGSWTAANWIFPFNE